MTSFKYRHFPQDIILQAVRQDCAYTLSYRNIEEILAERGIDVDHSTLNRWIVFCAPKLEKAFHKKKRLPGDRWRLDETYTKVKGQWKYFYRAVNKQSNTIDFILTDNRSKKAVLRYFTKTIKRNSELSLVNIDKSGANKAGIKQFNQDNNKRVKIRQYKHLNNGGCKNNCVTVA